MASYFGLGIMKISEIFRHLTILFLCCIHSFDAYLFPATCSALAFTNFQTFDNKLYEVKPKACGYTLLRDCSMASSAFTVRIQNADCTSTEMTQYCKQQNLYISYEGRSIVIERTVTDGPTSAVIKVEVDGEEIKEQFLDEAVVVELVGVNNWVLSTSRFDISFIGANFYVYVKEVLKSKTCGLCGSYNRDSTDDFSGPDNSPSKDAGDFLKAWLNPKYQPDCLKYNIMLGEEEPTYTDYCSFNSQYEQEANSRVAVLKKEDGPFKDCQVSANLYYERAKKTGCRHRQSLCDVIAGYAKACQDVGYPVGAWRLEAKCTQRKCS